MAIQYSSKHNLTRRRVINTSLKTGVFFFYFYDWILNINSVTRVVSSFDLHDKVIKLQAKESDNEPIEFRLLGTMQIVTLHLGK